ncbi:MAG TPA: chemotaxis protein CheX [Methylomirabilota bacterium]|jgi:chemotaxis protein CheX|nr:chemotaxis protein CheX [Methylomirabilota bacterium]
MEVTQSDLFQIVEGIWSFMLAMEIHPLPETSAESPAPSLLAACVQITGAWNGSVTLHCSPRLAHRIAAAMFTIDAESVTSEEMRDSLGELINMIGGGVKSLLPENSMLSLPTVVEGGRFTPFVHSASPVQQFAFACQEEPVWVTLREHSVRAAPRPEVNC